MEDKYYNSIALVVFILAKLSGILGIVFMFATFNFHYLLAILFLVADGLLLALTFYLCLKTAQKQIISLTNKCPSIAAKGFANCNLCKDYHKCWNEEK
jgi:hypothetical protein